MSETTKFKDFDAADAIADAYLAIGGLGDVLPDCREMAHAYLALRRAPRTETYAHDCGCETCGDHTPPLAPRVEAGEPNTRLALSILEKILGGLGYARTARNAEKQDGQYDELARALGVSHEQTGIQPFPADIVRALTAALRTGGV